MATASTARPKDKFYYGWWVAIGCVITYCAGASINWVTTITFPLLQREFGWTPTDLALLLAINSWSAVIWSSIGGWIVNRLGNRLTILIFMCIAAGAVFMYTTVTAIWQLIIYYPILCSFGTTVCIMVGVMSLPRKWFLKRAGLATGLIGGVWGFVSAIVFPGMSSLGAALGWRQAIYILVPIFLAVGVLADLILIRDSPEKMGLNVDGVSDEELKKIRASMTFKEEANMTFGEALRMPQFWLLGLGYGLTMDELGIVQGQSTIMATTYGIPIALAGIAMSALMIPAIFSRTIIGPIGDKYGRRKALIYSSIVAVVVEVGGYFFVHDGTSLIVFLVILGLVMMAGMTLCPPMCGDLFGRKNIAVIWGVDYAISAVVSGLITLAAGIIRTATGTYNYVFLLLAAGFLIQIVLIWFMKPTPVERQNLGARAGK